MLDIFLVGVQVVEHHIGVAGVGGSEDNDFEMLAHFLYDLFGIGSDVYPGL
jgi:hypothetical protein